MKARVCGSNENDGIQGKIHWYRLGLARRGLVPVWGEAVAAARG